MKTKTINVYSFDELSDKAKEKAIENWRNINYETGDYAWIEEIRESYNECKKEVYDRLEDDIQEEIKGARLYTWIVNNLSVLWTDRVYFSKHTDGKFYKSYYQHKYDCIKKKRSNILTVNNLDNCPFTGVCYDYDFLRPVIDFMIKPDSNTSNLDLVSSMPVLSDITDMEIESQNSYEYIKDTIEANDYEFDEDGNII